MRVDGLRRGGAIIMALAAGLALGGCGGARVVAYRPRPPGAAAPGGPAAPAPPARLAVLPFVDATEDFTQRGSIWEPEGLSYNMVKGGMAGALEPMTPPLWARAFPEELAASGRFRSARFVFEAGEAPEADWLITGTIHKAYLFGGWEQPSQFELELRAGARRGGPPAWVRTVSRAPLTPRDLYEGCYVSVSCSIGRVHDHVVGIVQALYEEASADLARALAGGGRPAGQPTPAGQPGTAPPPEKVDDTIRRILEGR